MDGFPVRDPANGIHCTTGSLGHGMPFAVGMAKALQVAGSASRVFVLVGDGECQEGTTWESLLIAARFQLDNLTVIVDWNGIQGSDRTADVLPMPNLSAVAELFGWDAWSVDGHAVGKLEKVLITSPVAGKPRLIVARTVKGFGVSFMEDDPAWHAQWLTDEQEWQAMRELAPLSPTGEVSA